MLLFPESTEESPKTITAGILPLASEYFATRIWVKNSNRYVKLMLMFWVGVGEEKWREKLTGEEGFIVVVRN